MNKQKKAICILAPGRICLFGDHQDYLGLPVIACAIDRHIRLSAVANQESVFNIETPDIKKRRSFSIFQYKEEISKGDHLLAALRVLEKRGCVPTSGFDVTITGTIPINAGISSSSALVVAWVKFLLEVFGAKEPIDPKLVAQCAYEAEVVEQGSPGGKMDQYSSSLGNVIYLETDERSFVEELRIPLKGLIIGESGIPKNTLGLLAEKKSRQIAVIKILQETQKDFIIQNASIEDLPRLYRLVPSDFHLYLKAAITNYHITKEARKTLKEPTLDYTKIGDLMNWHHSILQELGISIPFIDDMTRAAISAGAYGAKIVGSGGGGCIVAIAPQDKANDIIAAIKSTNAKDAYPVEIDPGARVIID